MIELNYFVPFVLTYSYIIDNTTNIEDIESETIIAFSVDYEIAKFHIHDEIHSNTHWFWTQSSVDGCMKYEKVDGSWRIVELGVKLNYNQLCRIRTGPAFPIPSVFDQ